MSAESILGNIVNKIENLFRKDMTSEQIAVALDLRAAKEQLDWRHSIVDLMKTLELDSSLKARRILATELGYTGEIEDNSAAMNDWLHAQVMKKVAEHGYQIPS